jgi:hypothetical protein
MGLLVCVADIFGYAGDIAKAQDALDWASEKWNRRDEIGRKYHPFVVFGGQITEADQAYVEELRNNANEELKKSEMERAARRTKT